MANLYHFKKKTHDVGNRFCLLYTEQVYAMVNLVAFGFLFIVSFASEVKNTSKCEIAVKKANVKSPTFTQLASQPVQSVRSAAI